MKLIIIQKFKRKIQELYLSPYHYYIKKKKKKKKKKKGNLQILQVTFCKLFFLFLNIKDRNGLPNIIFVFSILKIIFKSGSQTHIM